MNAELQWYLTMLCIALAVTYCLMRWRRSWRNLRSGGCGNSCGCPSEPAVKNSMPLIDAQSITTKIRNRQQNSAIDS